MPQVRWFTALVVTLAGLHLVGCVGTRGQADRHADDLDDLHAMMVGHFTSTRQAADDPRYFDIHLVMVPIWTERADGYWLYVEQAAATALDRPYRQRVYHLTVQDDPVAPLRSDVYTLPGDPLDFAGAWDRMEIFDAFTPDDLTLREGCAIYLTRRPDGTFVGATRGTGCESSLGGAAYATSEVEIQQGLLTSWDRGFTAEGGQAWGAEAGPYRFVLASSVDLP